MNSYKVTYLLNGEEHYDHITERTEKAAQKRLKGIYKDAEITDTELISTDAPATKDQEREALEKIKAMIAELGPQGYLATAFAGCFEDAEANIENNFADSMKARWLHADAQLNAAKGTIEELESQLATARSEAEALRGQFDFASQHIKKLERQQLPEQLRRDLWVMVTDEADVSRARMAKAAHMMAVCADNPACVGFKESVIEYRKEEKRAEAMEQRAAALDALEPKSE